MSRRAAGCVVWAAVVVLFGLPALGGAVAVFLTGLMMLYSPADRDFEVMGATAGAAVGVAAFAFTLAAAAKGKAHQSSLLAGALIGLGGVGLLSALAVRYGIYRATGGARVESLSPWWALPATAVLWGYEVGAAAVALGLILLLVAVVEALLSQPPDAQPDNQE